MASLKWLPMTWKKKDSVWVNQSSWNSDDILVEYKYDLTHSKVYKGTRSKFSSRKASSKKQSTSKKKSKTKRKSTKKSSYSPPSHSNSNSSSTPSVSITQSAQKINDFLMIATTCDRTMASSLLRNADWNVQNALEFYFKHQADIAANSQYHETPPNPVPTAKPKPNAKTKQKQPPLPSKPSMSDEYHLHSQRLTTNDNQNHKGKAVSFGKAGTRTQEQKKLVKESFDELYKSIGEHEIICFTDGACRGNPGPSGSGCVVLYGKNSKNIIQKSLALGHQTNNISELYAIGLALHIIEHHPSSKAWICSLQKQQSANNGNKIRIRIISDSNYSIGILSNPKWNAKKNKEIIGWIKASLVDISKHFLVSFHWVGGHSGISYNEMADSLANKGVEGSMKKKQSVDIKKPPNLFSVRKRMEQVANDEQPKQVMEIDLCSDDEAENEEEQKKKPGPIAMEPENDDNHNHHKNTNNNPLRRKPSKKRKLTDIQDGDLNRNGKKIKLSDKCEKDDIVDDSQSSSPPQSPLIVS